jgi:hypothetical protein
VAIRVLEKIASLTERFSSVCPILRVFKHALYGSYCGRNRRHGEQRVNITPLVSSVIALVSALTIEAWRGRGYSFDAFRPRAPRTVIEFDGSIYGLGGRVFALEPDGTEVLTLELALPLPDSLDADPELRTRSQNSCELLAVVVTALASLFVAPCPGALLIRGDSRVALAWMAEEHFASPLSMRTALAWTFLAHRFDLVVVESVHLPKEENTVCDGYSRLQIPPPRAGVARALATGGSREASDFCLGFVHLCNPVAAKSGPLARIADFQGFLRSVMRLDLPALSLSPSLSPPPFAPPSWFQESGGARGQGTW